MMKHSPSNLIGKDVKALTYKPKISDRLNNFIDLYYKTIIGSASGATTFHQLLPLFSSKNTEYLDVINQNILMLEKITSKPVLDASLSAGIDAVFFGAVVYYGLKGIEYISNRGKWTMYGDEEVLEDMEKLKDLKDFKKTINKKKVNDFEMEEFFIEWDKNY